MLKILLFLITITFALVTNATSLAELITDCDACHGNNGISTKPEVPTIAGFSEATLEAMMFAYVDEIRPAKALTYLHPSGDKNQSDMKIIARALTEEQILRLSAHYAALPFKAATQDFDKALAKQGEVLHRNKCAKCHSNNGTSPDDDSGILAGQWAPYLREAFSEYRTGKRETERQMLKSVNQLSKEQVEALVHYYASQQ